MEIQLINALSRIFNSMENSVAYFDIKSNSYRQSGNTVVVRNIYFDFKKSGFITASSVYRNKEALSKLVDYCAENRLICITRAINGFQFHVYNMRGDCIYSADIILFENVGRLSMYVFRKRYSNLVNR